MYKETMRVTTKEKRPYKYRKDGSVRCWIRTRPISRRPRRVDDVDYVYYQPSRHVTYEYEDLGVQTTATGERIGLGTRRRKVDRPFGYVPVIIGGNDKKNSDDEKHDGHRSRPLEMPTPEIFTPWTGTILNQCHQWCRTETMEYLCTTDDADAAGYRWQELSHTWLGWVVETSKPR